MNMTLFSHGNNEKMYSDWWRGETTALFPGGNHKVEATALFPHRNNEKKHSDWLRSRNNGIVPWWEAQRGNDRKRHNTTGDDTTGQLCMKPTGSLVRIVIHCELSFGMAPVVLSVMLSGYNGSKEDGSEGLFT